MVVVLAAAGEITGKQFHALSAAAAHAAAEEAPFVTIVMPALNEEAYIARAIGSIIPRSAGLPYELLVLDGGSGDRTSEIVSELAAANPRIRILFNEKRIQSAAVNLAAQSADARSRYLVRADCHTLYPEGFVERCIAVMADKDVASVVVPMRTEGNSCMQRAIAEAQNSRMGNGGSPHRLPGQSGFVDHGHHAAFDRRIFLDLGGYDESFTHNEDAEFDKRLVQAGQRIYLDTEATIVYYPRSTLRSLASQYYRYGAGRARTIMKHRAIPSMRQLLPVSALLACAGSFMLSLIHPYFLAVPLAYAGACTLWGIGRAARLGDACLALSGIAAMVMHMSWGSGFLSQLARSALQRPRDAAGSVATS